MLRYWPMVLPLFVFVAYCSPPGEYARAGILDLRGTDRPFASGPIRLDGEWEFFWRKLRGDLAAAGEDPVFAAKHPEIVAVPNSWTSYEGDGSGLPVFGYATYRLKLELDEPMDHMGLHGDFSLAYRLYVNGREVLREGEISRGREGFVGVYSRKISEPFRLERENEIAVEVANFANFESGFTKSLRLAPLYLLRARQRAQATFSIFLTGALFFMALYHLLLFGLDPSERAALYFAVLCIGVMIRNSLTNERFFYGVFPGLPFGPSLIFIYVSTFAAFAACILFLYYLYPGSFNRWFIRIVVGATALCTVLVILFPPALAVAATQTTVAGMVAISILYGLFVLGKLARERTPGAAVFFVAFLCFSVTALSDILYLLHVVNVGFLSVYGFAVFIFSQAIAVSRRILNERAVSQKLAGDLEESNERLLSLDRLKDDFLANTSHELRTPLQGIIGIADSLKDGASGPLAEDARRQLALIVHSGRRLSGLVNDILDSSRLRYGDIPLQPERIDLRQLIELELELIRFSGENEKSLRYFNDVPADLPAVIGDEARVIQIVQNLLSNAAKYTDHGEIRVSARVLDAGQVEVRVSDTGIGIAPDQLERIFRPFEQGAGGMNRERGGTGLGLSIARSLARLQGGKLWVETEVGRGSSFYFTLPLADSPAHAARATIDDRATSPAKSRSAPQSPPQDRLAHISAPTATATNDEPGDDARVLLVDDEPVNLEVMRNYLDMADCTALFAENALAAREVLSGGPLPDCIVLDIMMPRVSGLELAREIRGTYSPAELPILMVTAMTRTGDLMAALDAGANDYLTKPFEKEEFLLRVSNLISQARTVRTSRDAVHLAARRERARINSDLHDHLGASLTDLKLLSETALDNAAVNPEFADRLQKMVTESIAILRSDLLHLEDLDLLDENFLEGINLILLRRYVEAGREINVRTPDRVDPRLGSLLDEGRVGVLYAVIKEVATNDLKYGSGKPLWDFRFEESELRIHFRGTSFYRLERHGTGRGTAGMIRRLADIGGHLSMSIDSAVPDDEPERAIEIEIRVPLTRKPT